MNSLVDKNNKLLYNFKELQNATGIGRETLYALIKRDGFPTLSINGRYYFPRNKAEKWFEQHIGKQIEIAVPNTKRI